MGGEGGRFEKCTKMHHRPTLYGQDCSLVCVSLRLTASVLTIIHILVQCPVLCNLCTILSTEVIYTCQIQGLFT
jgi:hypothetical protein